MIKIAYIIVIVMLFTANILYADILDSGYPKRQYKIEEICKYFNKIVNVDYLVNNQVNHINIYVKGLIVEHENNETYPVILATISEGYTITIKVSDIINIKEN